MAESKGIRIRAVVKECVGIELGPEVELRFPVERAASESTGIVDYVFGLPEIWSEGQRVEISAIQSVTLRCAPHDFAMLEITTAPQISRK